MIDCLSAHGKMATVESKEVLVKTEEGVEKDENGKEKGKERVEVKQQQKTKDFLAGAQSLLTVIILVICCMVSFSSRLFAVIRFESIIHEFDPW